jgi:hypothetical protein
MKLGNMSTIRSNVEARDLFTRIILKPPVSFTYCLPLMEKEDWGILVFGIEALSKRITTGVQLSVQNTTPRQGDSARVGAPFVDPWNSTAMHTATGETTVSEEL